MIEVRVPDIGDFDQVDVVEVLVEPGKQVEADESLITLESEKASMDVPAPAAGVVREVAVKVGDKVGEGDLIVTLEEAGEGAAEATPAKEERAAKKEAPSAAKTEKAGKVEAAKKRAAPSKVAEAVEEVLAEEAPAEEEPAEEEPAEEAPEQEEPAEEAPEEEEPRERQEVAVKKPRSSSAPLPRPPHPAPEEGPPAHASPSIRRFARELGVDLARVQGSGPKGRILHDDVQSYVKRALTATREAGAAAAAPTGAAAKAPGAGIPPIPAIDFSKFGPIEEKPLSRIRLRAKENLHRSWLNVPHVTQHDTADITEMEAFRKANAEEAQQRGFKLTPLAFVMKAVVATLKEFPRVNSSLAPSGDKLIYKSYWHLGIAVDTEDGLVVPVIRDVDRKGIYDLAKELAEVSARARDRKLGMGEVMGATFTITSLGGIGGTSFTPIVNAPEVAILGVSRSRMEPVWRDGQFVPRLMLPLSLSYDHRVVDGAEAVRFTTYLASVLGDIRRLLL